MKVIPGGRYQSRQGKNHITMSPFRLGVTPVTWGIWKEYCQSESKQLPLKPYWGYLDNHPVVNVSWIDIMGSDGKDDFCSWASRITGRKLTLPSGTQWEYASHGGNNDSVFPWGNTFDSNKLWYYIINTSEIQRTAPVDRTVSIFRNGYGLTDMVGNVSQWCSDYFSFGWLPSGKDPICVDVSPLRSCRGECLYMNDTSFRCDSKLGFPPDFKGEYFGFRLSAGPN